MNPWLAAALGAAGGALGGALAARQKEDRVVFLSTDWDETQAVHDLLRIRGLDPVHDKGTRGFIRVGKGFPRVHMVAVPGARATEAAAIVDGYLGAETPAAATVKG